MTKIIQQGRRTGRTTELAEFVRTTPTAVMIVHSRDVRDRVVRDHGLPLRQVVAIEDAVRGGAMRSRTIGPLVVDDTDLCFRALMGLIPDVCVFCLTREDDAGMSHEGAPFIPAEWATAIAEYARDAEADSLAMVYGLSPESKQRFIDGWTPEAFMARCEAAERVTVRGVECFPSRTVRCSQCGQPVQAGAPSEDCCPAIHDKPAPEWVRAFYAEHGVWPCEW